MLSPLLRRYTEQHLAVLRAYFYRPLRNNSAAWWLGDVKLTIPLTLGMVAAALTDLDDRLAGRLRNLIITLICFLSPLRQSSYCFLTHGCSPSD